MLSIRIFVVTFLFFVSAVSAQTYVQLNGLSVHSKPGYNGGNYGIGIEHSVTKEWNIAAGGYYNSEYRFSSYAYGRRSFYSYGAWDLGIGLGLVTGYSTSPVLPMAFPEVCYDYLCGLVLPPVSSSPAVIGFHLKVPLN